MPECDREAESLSAVMSGDWSEAGADVRAHAAMCPRCAEVVAIASAMRQDLEQTMREAPIPAAGLVWWRAGMRLREEAVRTAARPIAMVQAVAAACGVGAGVALLGIARSWLDWSSVAEVVSRPFRTSMPDVGLTSSIALAVAIAWVILAPVAVYMATSDHD